MRLFSLVLASLPTLLVLAPGCGDSTFSAQDGDAAAGDSSSQSDAQFLDVTPADSGASDVANDQSVGPDAGRPFCSGPHDVCDDFEEPAGTWPASNWDSAQGASLMMFTTAESVSPSHALRVTMGDGGTAPYVQKAVNKAITQMTCDLDLRVDTNPGGSLAYLAEIEIASAMDDRVFVQLAVDPGNSAWIVNPGTKLGGTLSATPLQRDALVVGEWIHFKITIAANGTIVVKSPLGMITSSKASFTAVRSYFELGVGLEMGPAADGWVVGADNFVCDGT